jgi:hypothetical protein
MPAWFWPVIFMVLFLAGATVLVYLLFELRNKALKVRSTLASVSVHFDDLKLAANNPVDYQAPSNNLSDDPASTTQAWLKRRIAAERRKAERQRRLIKRLTNRK